MGHPRRQTRQGGECTFNPPIIVKNYSLGRFWPTRHMEVPYSGHMTPLQPLTAPPARSAKAPGRGKSLCEVQCDEAGELRVHGVLSNGQPFEARQADRALGLSTADHWLSSRAARSTSRASARSQRCCGLRCGLRPQHRWRRGLRQRRRLRRRCHFSQHASLSPFCCKLCASARSQHLWRRGLRPHRRLLCTLRRRSARPSAALRCCRIRLHWHATTPRPRAIPPNGRGDRMKL